jgi:hypothetical protein
MKKLLILIAILACMGCSDCVIDTAYGYSGCPQPPGETCGFLQEWDYCECECDWVF